MKDVKREGKWNFSNVCLQFRVLGLISFKKKKKSSMKVECQPYLRFSFWKSKNTELQLLGISHNITITCIQE